MVSNLEFVKVSAHDALAYIAQGLPTHLKLRMQPLVMCNKLLRYLVLLRYVCVLARTASNARGHVPLRAVLVLCYTQLAARLRNCRQIHLLSYFSS